MGKRTNTAVWSDKHSRWQLNVQKDGKRRSFYSSTPGRAGQREANAKADAWLDSGIDGTNTRTSALYEEWFTTVQQTTSQSNWRPIQSRWKHWILPEIGNKKISSLTEQHLQNTINKAFAAGLSKKTLMLQLSDIRGFLKFCRKKRVTTFNPEDLTIPKSAKTKGKTILQPADLVRLFNCNTTVYRGKQAFDDCIYAYRFQVLTGLRPGELAALKWSDIKGRTVYVQRSLNRYNEETTGKNENAMRSFVLSDLAYNVLQAQRAFSGTSESIFSIGTQSGYLKRWNRYCEVNGLTITTPYEMRHTFVSIAKGLPEGQVKSIVGHSANMDTFGIYGHSIAGEQEQAAHDLNTIFANVLTPKESGKG